MPPWMARATGASWYLAASCLVNSLRGRHSAHTGCDTTAKPAASNTACFTRMVPILFFADLLLRLVFQCRLPAGVPSGSDAAIQGHTHAGAGEQRLQRIFGCGSGEGRRVGIR